MTTRPVITLANSIIGVSILAMPFCFKQCGIILATIMLLLCGMLVKVTCHLLIKSALLARRKNFELLAFHTFGHLGKLCIEIGISGFLGGTAIAFFVVMGDLGPPLTANFLSIENSANLRLVILTGLGLFVALPLSMMRNIESLSVICASSIGFYLLVVLRVVLQAVPNLVSADWMSQVNLWRPAGMLQCFPIFSMALSCQANVFEVYGSLKDATPGDMNDVVRGAVNLCSAIYITIGFFGYVAFCHIENLSGNILTAFPQSHMLDVVKFGFLTSVAVSFPLVIFPCRTSIHSLLFRKTYRGIESTELVTDYITPIHFNLITLAIIVFSLIIGILIPDIELVLGLVGSTMGASICVVFPAAVFLSLTTKNTTERVAAKAIFIIGIVTMILGTYVNLFEQADSSPTTSPNPSLLKPTIEPVNVLNPAKPAEIADNVLKNISDAAAKFDKKKAEPGGDTVKDSGEAPKRQEPANPVPPNETVPPVSKEDKGVVKDNGTGNVKVKDKVVPVKDKESKEKAGVKESKKEVKPDKIISRDKKEDAEKKESTEKKKADTEKEAEKLLAQLENQKKEQQKILQQQKDILNDLKIHQEKERMAEEKKAIVDAVQQYNLQGAGVMQQHIPANLQQVPVNPQQVPVNPQQVPVNPQQVPAQANPQVPVQQQQQIVPVQQSVDNVGQPVFQQQQPIDPQQQQQQPIVPQQQQQPIVPQQQPVVPQQQVNPQQIVQMGVQQPQQVAPQVIQQVPAQVNQQQQAAPVQMVPQQQQPVVQPQQQQQQPVVQPQQQQQYVQPQQQQFIQQPQQVVPQVIPQQQVQAAQQQPQAPVVPQNVPVRQQNMQGSGVVQQNVQPQAGQVMNQTPQQPVVNQQNEQPIAPVAINNQQLPQQQQQIPQQSNEKPVESINQNPAPQQETNVDNQQGKHVIADYDGIHKEETGETGDKNKKQDAKVPGRDLKDDKGDEGNNREKRDIICENDPDCDEKFKVDFKEKAISGMAVAGRDLLEFISDSVN